MPDSLVMKDTINLRARLDAWRDHKGLSWQDVAERVGCSRARIYRIAMDGDRVQIETLNAICTKAFKTDLGRFFGPLPKQRAA